MTNMLPGGSNATARLKLSGDGYDDDIYQRYPELKDAESNFYQASNPALVDMTDHTSETTAMTVGLKLVSGLLQNERYLPLLALKGAGLTLELTMASSENAFWAGTHDTADPLTNPPVWTDAAPTSYTIFNVEYIAQTVDFDEGKWGKYTHR
jgi:hypothetical protein